MVLGIDKTGPSAGFFDAHGKKRMGLGTTNSSEGLELKDTHGRVRAVIGYAASRKMGSILFTGESGIMFFDKKGHLIWQAPQ